LTEAELAGVIGIAFLAAGCQSLTGFGSSLLAVPLLSLYLDAKQAVVILASALLLLAPRLTLGGRNTLSSLVTGAFSGLLRASTSMAGPPVVLYTLSHERDIEEFRSTILALFLITGLLAIPGLVVADLISRDAVIATAVAIPGMALGLLVGTRLRSRVQPTFFRTLVLAVLVITSIGVIVSASGEF